MNRVTNSISNRAYQNNISIATVCREAGMSRDWFEKLKKNVPRSLEAYIKINEFFDKIEKNNAEV